MGVLSYAFFAPFAKNYSQSYNGFHQSDQTTALSDYLGHFGILLFFVTGFLLFSLNRSMTRSRGLRIDLLRRQAAGARRSSTRRSMLGALILAAIAVRLAGQPRTLGRDSALVRRARRRDPVRRSAS